MIVPYTANSSHSAEAKGLVLDTLCVYVQRLVALMLSCSVSDVSSVYMYVQAFAASAAASGVLVDRFGLWQHNCLLRGSSATHLVTM